jgi:predicted O-methyltransferase YrrM
MKWQDLEGWFDEENYEQFKQFNLPAEPFILEIGTYKGRSTTAFAELWPDCIIVTCDPENYPDRHLPRQAVFQHCKGTEMSLDPKEESVDLLFLDDSHTYDTLKENYDHFLPMVKPGGIIAFHDYAFESADVDGVRRFVDELQDCTIERAGRYGLAWRVK